MESDIEENKRRQMEEIEALNSIYEENFILGKEIWFKTVNFKLKIYFCLSNFKFIVSETRVYSLKP